MAVTVEKTYPQDLEKIFPLLQLLDSSRTMQDWRNIVFEKKWQSGQEHVGYHLIVDGKIAGFIGLIFSRRSVGGELYNWMGVTTWIVHPEFRQHSLRLLLKLREIEGHTACNLTPRDHVYEIFEKIGYKPLERVTYIVPFGVGSFGHFFRKIKLETDPDRVSALVSDEEKKYLEDHQTEGCKHILLSCRDEQCYVIANVVHKKGIPFLRIYYVGNKRFLIRYFHTLFRLRWKMKFFGIMIDGRMLEYVKPLFSFELERKMLFQSKNLSPGEIDDLYSELIVLKM